jgi:ABC-type iron transport system FetAB ATPase subunit
LDARPTSTALRTEGLRSALAGPFDIQVEPGGCIGVSGPSGSGKSLFLRMIADLDPNEGEVWLGDKPRSSFTGPAWRRQVVYAPAESGWWTDAIAAHFRKDQLDQVREMAERLGLPADILDGAVSRLSTGERQRLSLIRALVVGSPALLLDEPTSALDGAGVERIEAILRERMAVGTAIVLVTHDPAQAVRLAGRRYVMHAGRLEAAP